MSGLLCSCRGHLGAILEAWQGNRDASRGEDGDTVSLSSCHRDIGIPINFQEESSPFETLNSALLSSCQRDVRPHVEMMQETTALSRVATGISNIPSSCEMINEPGFKSLQGSLALFRVRAPRCPFNLRQKTGSLSHTYSREKPPLEVLVES